MSEKNSSKAIIALVIIAIVLIVGASLYYVYPSITAGNNRKGDGSNTQPTPAPTWNPFPASTATPNPTTYATATATPNTWNLTSPSPTPFNPWDQPTATPFNYGTPNPSSSSSASSISSFGTEQIIVTISFQNGATPVILKSSVADFMSLLQSLAQESTYYNNALIQSVKVDQVVTCNIDGVTNYAILSQEHMELYLKPELVPKTSSTGTFPEDGSPAIGTSWAKGDQKVISSVTIDQQRLDQALIAYADTNNGVKTGNFYLMITAQTSVTVTANGQQRTFIAGLSNDKQVGLDLTENSLGNMTLNAVDIGSTYGQLSANNSWLIVGVAIVIVAVVLGVAMKIIQKRK